MMDFTKYLMGLALAAAACSCTVAGDGSGQEAQEDVQETAQEAEGQQYRSSGDASLLQVTLPGGIDNVTVKYDYMTVYFNPSQRIPNCVAYELTRTQVSMADAPDAERRDNYKFYRDENVKGCPDWWEYKNTGYTRGHMAPAMDMRWNKTAMAQCFMMTNMCPQLQELNDGQWRHMEEAIHSWGRKNERLVIFTGPVMSQDMKKMGKKHNIAVPERFFKVVYAPASNRAIAFVMDNRELDKTWTSYAVTIDHVEGLTGIDFLSALDDDIETAVESKQNIKNWPQYTPSR